jgi:hypothetical protein
MKYRFFPFCFWRLFRVGISFTFFLGGILLVFWAQGFRFDFSGGKVISTGVISASTHPADAQIFLNANSVGTTPDILLGVPLESHQVCFQKRNHRFFCQFFSFDETRFHRIKNIHLLPHVPLPTYWGKASHFLWDPRGRGFLLRFPSFSSALVYENGILRFLDSIPSQEIFLTGQGNLLFPFGEKEKIFFHSPEEKPSSLLSPSGKGILFQKGNTLLYRDTVGSATHILLTPHNSLQSFFFLPESESFVGISDTKIFFFSSWQSPPQFLFEKDASAPVYFFSGPRALFWQWNGKILSFSF